MSRVAQWRGLVALVGSAVEGASVAIERVQRETARRPFAVLEQIEPLAEVARDIHAVHDVCVMGTHTAIRLVTRVVTRAVDRALDAVDGPPEGT